MIKSFFKKYAVYFQRFTGAFEQVKVQTILQVTEYERLRKEMEHSTPANTALSGKKIYSQTDEDGIIEEIFKLIPNNKTFLEIGIETGLECNTLYLLMKGWKGTWVEGNPKYFKTISHELGGTSFPGKLNVVNSFIDRDNITDIFRNAEQFFGVGNIDFFSLDIDGNDFYIMEQLFNNGVFPKVICVEYNAKFAPPMSVKIEYNKTHVWDYSDYMGCSLQCYADLFTKHNYTLISCNIPGINAFFVQNEFAHLFAKYTIEQLYQPYRFYLSPIVLAQKPSLKYLKAQLQNVSNGEMGAI